MNEYHITRANAPVPLSGDVAETPWADAGTVDVDEFPWYEGGERQATTARACYDDDALYLQFRVEDAHASASVTELNGPVSTDSCVEFFATPEPERQPHYVNFEANCCGTILVGYGPDRHDRRAIPADLAAELRVETSVEGATKAESPPDDDWWLAAELPFATLRSFTGTDVDPDAGTVWRGNFYRCGGETDPQFATWNPIDAPDPDFHRPEQFGRLAFE